MTGESFFFFEKNIINPYSFVIFIKIFFREEKMKKKYKISYSVFIFFSYKFMILNASLSSIHSTIVNRIVIIMQWYISLTLLTSFAVYLLSNKTQKKKLLLCFIFNKKNYDYLFSFCKTKSNSKLTKFLLVLNNIIF